MADFFGQETPSSANQQQQPQLPGTSMPGQQPPQTGASTQPAPAAAPGSAAPTSGATGGQAPHAPAFTNFATFLGAQDPNAIGGMANAVTQSANTNAAATNAAGNAASNANTASTAAGTNTGSVGGGVWTAGSGTAYTPTTPTATTPTPTSTSSSTSGAGGTSSSAPAPATPTSPATTPVTSSWSTPSYDLSKVNLQGYQGPSAADATNAFAGADANALQAQQNAKALQSGQVTGNAFDNALLTQSPAWQTLQKSITGENAAAQNEQAQGQGAQQAVTNAQNTSGVSQGVQKAQLGQAGATEATAAAANQAQTQAVGADLANPTADSLTQALNNPQALQSLGLTTAQVTQLQSQLASGAITPQEAQASLSSYAAAAGQNSGYTAGTAATTNSINSLLGNTGAPTASAGAAGTGSVDLSSQAATNSSDLAALKGSMANLDPMNASNSGVDNAVNHLPQINDLLNQGYSMQQISQLAGLPLQGLIQQFDPGGTPETLGTKLQQMAATAATQSSNTSNREANAKAGGTPVQVNGKWMDKWPDGSVHPFT